MKKIIMFFLAVSLGFTACDKTETDAAAQLEIDKGIIENYLADNDLTAQSTASGLYYIIDNQGAGLKPSLSSTVTVTYTGKLINGSVFDSGTSSFPLVGVIQGWQEGIPLFNAGGTGKLIIPSGLGYGSDSRSSIPANSVLIFDIYLVSVK
ncbi:MAG: FKBP-type peptidyl-prolyl cis-trans isomerase [Bacteroidales bacterium]|nr:FKBP-type peptidyl-prolyl cis-trans isomerase [Bacteroidales bacterium]